MSPITCFLPRQKDTWKHYSSLRSALLYPFAPAIADRFVQAHAWYEDALAFMRTTTSEVLAPLVTKDRVDSYPRMFQRHINKLDRSQSFLHEYGPDGISHFANPLLRELFRRFLDYFKQYLPELRTIDSILSPIGYAFPAMLVRLA